MAVSFTDQEKQVIISKLKVAADTVRALFLTINHRPEIGADYNTVLQIMIEGACEKMFPA